MTFTDDKIKTLFFFYKETDRLDFRGFANLDGARFIDCDLRNAQFQGVSLRDADFTGSDLEGAQFLDAILTGAKFQYARNLSTEALGGAVLTGASLKDELKGFKGLEGVAASSRYFQTLFKIILGSCSFSILTVLSIPDPTEAGSVANLQFLGVPIAAKEFAWIAPATITIIFIYMLIYVGDTWVQLSKLPAIFPDGSPLDRRAYPSTLNCLVRKYSWNLHEPPPFFYEVPIAYFLLFWITLLTLGFFWGSYLKVHSLGITFIQALMISIALNATLYHVVLCMTVIGEKGWREDKESWKGDWMWRGLHFLVPYHFKLARSLINESDSNPRCSQTEELRGTRAACLMPTVACQIVLLLFWHSAALALLAVGIAGIVVWLQLRHQSIKRKPLAEITRKAIAILRRELGTVDTIRFINQFTTGRGGYTSGRVALSARVTLDQIIADIKAAKPGASEPSPLVEVEPKDCDVSAHVGKTVGQGAGGLSGDPAECHPAVLDGQDAQGGCRELVSSAAGVETGPERIADPRSNEL